MKLPLLDRRRRDRTTTRSRKLAGPTIEFLGPALEFRDRRSLSRSAAPSFSRAKRTSASRRSRRWQPAPGHRVRRGRGGGNGDRGRPAFFSASRRSTRFARRSRTLERGAVTIGEAACRARAAEFSRERFQRELVAVIDEAWRASGRDPAPLAELLSRRW